MAEIVYFYSMQSVFAYLGAARFMDIAAAAGRRIVHKPMDLDRVVEAAYPQGFKGRSKAHRNYYFGREIERWAEYRGVELKVGLPSNHFHDMNLANSMVIACTLMGGNADKLAHELMRAHWTRHADLADEATLSEIAAAAGMEPKALFEAARAPDAQAAYQANSTEAIERAVFGSPTYIVDGDMFYGQDHLELVERALNRPFSRTWPDR